MADTELRAWWWWAHFWAEAYVGRRQTDGWSLKKQRVLVTKTLAVLDWYRAQGTRPPDAVMDLWAAMVVSEDQSLSPSQLQTSWEIADRLGFK